MSTKPIRCLIFLVLGLTLVTSVPVRGASGAPGTDNAFYSRFAYVEKLVERSSVARQIEASANDQAKAKWHAARSFYRQAQDAYNADDDKLTYDLLNGAIRNMGEAARMATRNELLNKKRKREFQDRLETVKALLVAHDRISSDVGAQETADLVRSLIQHKVAQAEELYKGGDLSPARNQLDEAYGSLTVAIEELRGGRTLVHVLRFANKEEEYAYESNRNRSHRMLVKVLLEDEMHRNPSAKQKVEGLMSKADTAQATAARYAEAGHYGAAIAAMEKSTSHIVRAMRGAGIYIPG